MDWTELRKLLFSFDGRINRGQYWGGQLAVFASAIVFVMLIVATSMAGISSLISRSSLPTQVQAELAGMGMLLWLFSILYGVGSTWVTLAVQIKRWHDRGKTGWFSMIQVVPLLVWIFAYIGGSSVLSILSAIAFVGVLVWSFVELGCLAGVTGPNEYGPDPFGSGRTPPRPVAIVNPQDAITGTRSASDAQPFVRPPKSHAKGTVRFSGFDSNGHVVRLDVPLDRLEQQPMLISRDPGPTALTIIDPTISRQHGMLSVDEKGLWIKDFDSKNGTSVDGVKLIGNGPASQVYDGSRIVLGGTSFTIKVEV